MNISSKELGVNSESQRAVVTKISCPNSAPVILGDTLSGGQISDRTSRRQEIDLLERDMSSPVSECLLVPKNMPEYTTVDFLIELLLTPAFAEQSQHSPDLITLQTHRLSMQVSKTWQYNSSSEFLLLTSKSTTKDTIISWSRFIENHLHRSVDVWNVSLYGGFEVEETPRSVLGSYAGKTILALDDDLFSYFDRGQRSILDFIDPLEGSMLSRKGTRVVSVHKKAKERIEREGENIEHVAHAAALKTSHYNNNELQRFENTSELLARLHKLREDPLTLASNQKYFIPFHGSSSRGKGRGIAKKLTKEFPLDRFLVTDSNDGLGIKIVHCGTHGQSYSTAQVAQTSNGVGRIEEFSGLNPAEAYACVAALPLEIRLDILLEAQQATRTFQYSDFIQNATLSSVKADLHDQIQAIAKHPRWRDGLFSNSETISTKSLFDSANDDIAAVLNHKFMLSAGATVDDSSSQAGQILRSIIQSARCQTTEQLLMKWFSPVKRTRSHVRRSLMENVQDLIVSNGPTYEPNSRAPQDRIKTFKRSVPQRILNKNCQVGINRGVQAITHDAIRDVKQSLTSVKEVMSQSIYKSPDEISTEKKSYEKAELQRKRDRIQHRSWKKELGLDMTRGAGFVNTNDAAEFEADSSMYSSELASTSAYSRGMASNRSETSTVTTLPEMDENFASSSIAKSRNLQQPEINDDRPLEPLRSVSRVTSTELTSSTSEYDRGVVSGHSRTSTKSPWPETNQTSVSSIKILREPPQQLEIKDAGSPQPLSTPPILDSVELSSNSVHGQNLVSGSDGLSPALSPPELDEHKSWVGEEEEESHELPQPHSDRPESPSLLSPSPTAPCVTAVPPELGGNTTNSRIEKQSEECPALEDATSYPAASAPAVSQNQRLTNDDDSADDEPFIWSEYDEDELRIDWTIDNASGETA